MLPGVAPVVADGATIDLELPIPGGRRVHDQDVVISRIRDDAHGLRASRWQYGLGRRRETITLAEHPHTDQHQCKDAKQQITQCAPRSCFSSSTAKAVKEGIT